VLERVRIPAARAERPHIVLLHEGLGSVTHWRDFPHRLAAATGCGALIYSRRGYGASPPLEGPRTVDYLHQEAFHELPALLEEEHIERPVLFGHSDGASIALLHASRFPTAALVLEAPHVFVEEVTIEGVRKMKSAYETTDLSRRLARYHADVDGVFRGWNDIWLHPGFREWNIEAALDGIACPVLLIQGEQDEFATTAQLAAIKLRISAAETLLIPGCGHTPHREHPETVLMHAARFLDRSLV